MQAIIDWGIGGFGLYGELKRVQPETPFLYFSDAGYAPYGRVATADLVDRLRRVVAFVEREGATSVVLACNAASTVAPRLRSRVGLPIIDIIESGVEAVLRSGVGSVGVVGGERTIRSGIYRRRLRAEGIDAIGRVAQPLSGMIERGAIGSPPFEAALREILPPLGCLEGLLLACTHYAAAMPHIQEVLPATRIIDPVPVLVERIIEGMGRRGDTYRAGRDRIFTSGDVGGMKRGAKKAFGVEVGVVASVDL